MEKLEITILALIQGLTEFLPISSSAHLLLPSKLLGWDDQGLAFDVAVHVGSLIAVVVYFRHELISMTRAWFSDLPLVLKHQPVSADARLAWAVILGTIPVGLAGLLFKSFIEENFRSAFILAMTIRSTASSWKIELRAVVIVRMRRPTSAGPAL